MPKYHCPYCSPQVQIYREHSDGMIVCTECGDYLIEIPAVKPSQIVAIVAAIAFIAPLIITAFAFIQDLYRPQRTKNFQAMATVSTSQDSL